MKLEAGKLYSKPTSGLLVEVLWILEQNDDKIRFKGRLWNRTRSIMYEIEVYDLTADRIADWKEIRI